MLNRRQDERVSLWSVLSKYWNSFIWILLIFLVVWTTAFALSYDFDKAMHGLPRRVATYTSADASATPFKREAPLAVALAFVKDYVTYTLPAVAMLAIIFVLIADGKEYLKVTITRWLREKVEEEQMEKVHAEGVREGIDVGAAKSHAAWLVWYEKLKEAQRKGKPFDEPPPEL